MKRINGARLFGLSLGVLLVHLVFCAMAYLLSTGTARADEGSCTPPTTEPTTQPDP